MAEKQENYSLVGNEERTSESDVFSCGIGRLFETTRRLRVRDIVLLVFIGGLCAILLGLILFSLIRNSNFDRLNRAIPNQIWYIETVYEIITESIKDTSPKEDGLMKEGQGVGDIKGKLYLAVYIHSTRYHNGKKNQCNLS